MNHVIVGLPIIEAPREPAGWRASDGAAESWVASLAALMGCARIRERQQAGTGRIARAERAAPRAVPSTWWAVRRIATAAIAPRAVDTVPGPRRGRRSKRPIGSGCSRRQRGLIVASVLVLSRGIHRG